MPRKANPLMVKLTDTLYQRLERVVEGGGYASIQDAAIDMLMNATRDANQVQQVPVSTVNDANQVQQVPVSTVNDANQVQQVPVSTVNDANQVQQVPVSTDIEPDKDGPPPPDLDPDAQLDWWLAIPKAKLRKIPGHRDRITELRAVTNRPLTPIENN